MVGREISYANFTQAGHAEVSAVHNRPVLPAGKHSRANSHVREKHPQAGGGGHDDPLLRRILGGFGMAVLHAASVNAGVSPAKGLRQHFAHILEVQNIQRDAKDRVHDGGYFAANGAWHHVTVANHGEDGEAKHERGWERPFGLGAGTAAVAILYGASHVALEIDEYLQRLLGPLLVLQNVVLLSDDPQTVQSDVGEL